MHWLDTSLLSTLGQALLHSLWEFTLLIGLAFLLAQQLPGAAHRYRVYLGVLLFLPVIFGITFYAVLPTDLTTLAFAGSSDSLVIPTLNQGSEVILASEVASTSSAPAWLWLSDHFLELMALAYLTGLLLLGLRSGKDWWQIRQLRKTASLPGQELLLTYQRLQDRLPGLAQYPLRLSGQVSSALTVGVFRPFILLPFSLVNALEPEEMEAILLHEMAHLFRHDHLWNAIQTLLTQLFFYHPMVYWLRLRLDREREYACDDLVTGQIDRQHYAQSLLKVARLSITHENQYVMQAQGKSHFTQRVQRLFLPPTSLQSRRWWLLPTLILSGLFTVVLFAQQAADLTKPIDEIKTKLEVFQPDVKSHSEADVMLENLTNAFVASTELPAGPVEERAEALVSSRFEETVESKTHVVKPLGSARIGVLPINFDELIRKQEQRKVVKQKSSQELSPVQSDPGITFSDSTLILLDGVAISGRQFNQLDKNAVALVEIFKEDQLSNGIRNRYNVLVQIELKRGYTILEAIGENPEPLLPTQSLDEMLSGSFQAEKTILFVNNQQTNIERMKSIDADEIESMEIITNRKVIRKAGFKKYQQIIKVNTKPKAPATQLHLAEIIPDETYDSNSGQKVGYIDWDNTAIEINGVQATLDDVDEYVVGKPACLIYSYTDQEKLKKLGYQQYEKLIRYVTVE